jgi:hypothetical protein
MRTCAARTQWKRNPWKWCTTMLDLDALAKLDRALRDAKKAGK